MWMASCAMGSRGRLNGFRDARCGQNAVCSLYGKPPDSNQVVFFMGIYQGVCLQVFSFKW